MAPKNEQEARAAAWRVMQDYACRLAKNWLRKGPTPPPDKEEEVPKRRTRNIGPVQFARKIGKVKIGGAA